MSIQFSLDILTVSSTYFLVTPFIDCNNMFVDNFNCHLNKQSIRAILDDNRNDAIRGTSCRVQLFKLNKSLLSFQQQACLLLLIYFVVLKSPSIHLRGCTSGYVYGRYV